MHSKGILAGKSIELTTFQKFLVCNIEAWLNKETDRRRFKYAYIQLARKNGKSQVQAGLALYEIFGKHIATAEIYMLGVERAQAKLVFDEIPLMIKKPIRKKLKITQKDITHPASNSVITHLSKAAGKTGDGKNPQFVSIDEYHAHPTAEMYEVMESGMGARVEPLIIIITTAGFDYENKPCYQEYKDCANILEGSMDNDEYFVLICELEKDDDIKDSTKWPKANPVLCSYPEGIERLESFCLKAFNSEDVRKRRNFETKNCNRWINAGEKAYIDDIEKWNDCPTYESLEIFRGMDCYIGIDLSKTGDLTSVAFEFPFEDTMDNIRKYAVFTHSFIPAQRVANHEKTDKCTYDDWIKQGWLTATEANAGLIVDYWAVVNYIEDIKVKYDLNVKAIAYDAHNANMFIGEMESRGYDCIEIAQSCRKLDEPTTNFRDLMKVQQITRDSNKLFTWALSNCEVDTNSFGEIKISKISRFKRIDPVAATINAHKLAMDYWHDKSQKPITEQDIDDFYDNFKRGR
jgi:phage terminase large subunit-like protein